MKTADKRSRLRRPPQPMTGWEGPAAFVIKNDGDAECIDCRYRPAAGASHPSRPVIALKFDTARLVQSESSRPVIAPKFDIARLVQSESSRPVIALKFDIARLVQSESSRPVIAPKFDIARLVQSESSRPVIAPKFEIARPVQSESSQPVIAPRFDLCSFLAMPVVVCLLLITLSVSAFAQAWGQGPPPMSSEITSDGKPRMLEGVGIDQKLDGQLPLDLMFKNEDGVQVRLGDYFGKRPVVLSLVYYNCPMLCNQVLNGLTSSMEILRPFDIGKEFEVVTVSFDPRETPELARQKKETYIRWYSRPGASDGWHFLTGGKHEIDKLSEAVGFRYRYDPATDQFVHASGIMLATSQGKLARYFYGVEYAPRDLKLGLIEASENKIGSPVDKLLLYCYHYDPAAGKYGPVVMNMIRVGGAVTLIGFATLLLWMRRRTAKRQAVTMEGTH